MSADGATEPGQSPLSAVSQIVEPSIDILKAIPHGIIELILRGASLVLAVLTFLAASSCLGYLGTGSFPSIAIVTNTQAASGWVLFLSFWVVIYQTLAIVLLFMKVRILYTVIPVTNWSLFFLLDLLAIGIAAIGHICASISLAVYADQWTGKIKDAAGATSAFSFLSFFLFIGMIGFFFTVRYIFNLFTHGEEAQDPSLPAWSTTTS